VGALALLTATAGCGGSDPPARGDTPTTVPEMMTREQMDQLQRIVSSVVTTAAP
jgi:hypothetical protein